ncbi:uncharacterized protein LOC114245387 [Bombyx mandarina]|uniref:Uncharacterized protein LOC114245387 n=1 Tax=Bombyx mandarina TaxID=7092 RepID=A0A6J2JUQ1_BOMMA|nr:uncharacterized protein LOC114245387 [Bombyx mandarina]
MDTCFVACCCNCAKNYGFTKTDLDRFTDNIENLLNNNNGRQCFRDFMEEAKMRHGLRTLHFWERVDKYISSQDTVHSASHSGCLKRVDSLIDIAEKIEEFDFAIMERLCIARESENREEIITVLKLFKVEAAKALKREYNAFKRHFVVKN